MESFGPSDARKRSTAGSSAFRTRTDDPGSVAVVVVCGRRSIECSIVHGGQRVLEVLNDKSSAFLRVTEPVLSFPGQVESLDQLTDGLIPKSGIDCVLLQNEQHEAPFRRQHAKIVKQPYATFALLPEYEICGTSLWSHRPDSVVLLSADAPTFFPVAPATLWDGTGATECVASTVAFINKERVSMLSIGKRTS